MLISNENRYQYIYFSLSGLVASLIILLFYISIRTTDNEKYRDEIKLHQKTLIFNKPATNWEYNNTWRYIGHASLKHQIYSAYFDPRTDLVDVESSGTTVPVGSLRIFAILPQNFRDTVMCILRYEDFSIREVVASEVESMPEYHDFPFVAHTIMCPLRVERSQTTVNLPQSVALAYSKNSLSHLSPTFVPISYPRRMVEMLAKSRPTISVCVGPLHNNFSNALRVVEFVEMYRLQGATHFYFYYLNASSEVKRTVDYYRQQGVADVLDWNLNDRLDDIHYAGVTAQFNDCIYRAMIVDNHRYAAVVDFDEILMTLKHNSLKDYLRQCDEGLTSAFVFRNVFFHIKDSADNTTLPPHIRNRRLYTQTKVRRTVEILPAYTRAKCIVNTRAIIEMANHRVQRSAPGYADYIVHQSIGLLFHYRDKCLNCRALLMVDYTARRFGSLIWDRVDDVCLRAFMENEGMCPYQ